MKGFRAQAQVSTFQVEDWINFDLASQISQIWTGIFKMFVVGETHTKISKKFVYKRDLMNILCDYVQSWCKSWSEKTKINNKSCSEWAWFL